LAAAKQEVAGDTNQGSRADTNSGHFAGSDVVLGVGRGVKGCHQNDPKSQQEEFSQRSSLERTPCREQSDLQNYKVLKFSYSALTSYLQ
jgi:hypothetical protein